MTRKQMLGIKERVERPAQVQSASEEVAVEV